MSLDEDTLSRRALGVLAGRRGRLHLLCVGKLCEETRFEILPAFVLLPAVDEHLVLRDNKGDSGRLRWGKHIRSGANLLT